MLLPFTQVEAADPPCNNWTRHTRTLPTICPEVILDGLTGQAMGIAAIGSLAFDTDGSLYVSRPATGEVLRLTPQAGYFNTPEVIASHLDFPGGIACAQDMCYTATDTTITRLSDGKAIVTGLPSGALRPLRIGPDGRLYTTDADQLISLATDGTDERSVPGIAAAPADFAWSPSGTLWFSDGKDSVRSVVTAIAFDPDSAPSGIAFYPTAPNMAFPEFAGGLLVVTSGSWNTPTISGYELWEIQFTAPDQPGSKLRLIPANTERSSSDAALVALSFFPDHPVSVAVSAEGWIYVATREGRVIRLRPRH
jgi:glucose/arabinose dehydrogenase